MAGYCNGDELIFFCNGRKVVEKNVDPEMTLATYLRLKLLLYGTKVSCIEGGCGACTVMVSSVHPWTRLISHYSVVSCLYPICQLHGKAVTTIEGIGNSRARLHAVQERLAKSHGSQCGFCSPGMVMSMYSMLRSNPSPDVQEVLRHLEGNLCRCTGYRSILDGFKSFCGENCCQLRGGSCQSGGEVGDQQSAAQSDRSAFKPYDPSQEPIFPPELLTDIGEYNNTLTFRKGHFTWIVASSMEELLQLKAEHPSAKLIMGNTAIGVLKKVEGIDYPLIISPGNGIQELTQVTTSDMGITIGAGVTVNQVEQHLKKLLEKLPEHQTRAAAAIVEMIRWFAGQQVRNMASIGGSVAGASGLLDLSVILMATNATVTLAKAGGIRRTVPLDKNFYPVRTRCIIAQDEILASLHIPYTNELEYVYSYKVAQRHHNSRCAVSSGLRVTFEPENYKVRELCLVFGGVGKVPVVAQKTSNKLIGQIWNQSLLQDAMNSVSEEVIPGRHANGIGVEYRRALLSTCLLRFYVRVCERISNNEGLMGSFERGPLSDPSIHRTYNEDTPVSTQIYQPPPLDQPDADPVGRPLVHRAAIQQCTGEATYCNDIPLEEGELHLAIVVSTRAHANIVSIDASKALEIDGVEAFICHTDVPGTNAISPEEEVFASEKVHCVGQPIGAIAASSHDLAVKAARLVKVQYEDLAPVILSIQDAIKESSFFETVSELKHGDTEASFKQADHVLEGEFDLGGQEHFYLETHSCVVRPREDNEMEIHASIQDLTGLQIKVAKCLDLPHSKIFCHAKRVGGSFGGKEDRMLHYLGCVISAKKTGRSVRLRLERAADMLITGGRHPFHAKYRVGYQQDGRILALDAKLYCDGGYLSAATIWVMRQAMLLFNSYYQFSGYLLTGYSCRTNKPSNTAMRGFGVPQGLAIMEHILSEVAAASGVSQRKIHEINFRPEGASMLEGADPVDMATFRECWETCLRLSDYERRLKDVDDFNTQHRWRKRGLAILPTKQGNGMFGSQEANQGAALVHIYTDGSVLVNHGGVETGQGLNTKLVQVASRVLGVPVTNIHTSATATDKVPNTTTTGGSIGTDLYGGAVKVACECLKERLEPYRTANPQGGWEDWVQAAYVDRVSLSTTGLYKKPNISWNVETSRGNPFLYYTMGVGVSEVEVDCLTGEHQLLRTDIVMDVGKSLNPAIDIGQIEGGFIQGYGYFTMEEIKHTPQGALLTDGPSSYKIPGVHDIPKEFNVTLLRNTPKSEDRLYSSKGIGEPPFFLGFTAFCAIKHALYSARMDSGLTGLFKFNAPASVENVRMSCGDRLVRK